LYDTGCYGKQANFLHEATGTDAGKYTTAVEHNRTTSCFRRGCARIIV
jgi:hypothetical protein